MMTDTSLEQGPRIAFLGTGAQGASIAADFAAAGLDVTFIDQWPAHIEAIRENGITVNLPTRSFNVRVPALHLCQVAEGRASRHCVASARSPRRQERRCGTGLKLVGTRISMDGKGRCLDNIFIERLWRSLKYECVYLHAWQTGSQARAGIGRWITFHNHRRPHTAHGGQPPAVVYFTATQTDQQVQAVA